MQIKKFLLVILGFFILLDTVNAKNVSYETQSGNVVFTIPDTWNTSVNEDDITTIYSPYGIVNIQERQRFYRTPKQECSSYIPVAGEKYLNEGFETHLGRVMKNKTDLPGYNCGYEKIITYTDPTIGIRRCVSYLKVFDEKTYSISACSDEKWSTNKNKLKSVIRKFKFPNDK